VVQEGGLLDSRSERPSAESWNAVASASRQFEQVPPYASISPAAVSVGVSEMSAFRRSTSASLRNGLGHTLLFSLPGPELAIEL